MKSTEIIDCLVKLQDYLGYTLKPSVQKMYVERLKMLPDGVFKIAMVRIIEEFKPTSTQPFPLISTILEFLGQDVHSLAVNAVARVKKAAMAGQYKSVDLGDRVLHGVIERYGGWPDIVLWSDKEWSYNERNFINAYKAAKQGNVLGPSYLPGLLEIDNRSKGLTPDKLRERGLSPLTCGYIVETDKELIELQENVKSEPSRLSYDQFIRGD